MNVHSLLYPYLVVLVAACAISIYRFRHLDFPARIFCLLLCLTVLNELLATIFARVYKNNAPVYNIYGLAEIFLLGLFFNQVVDVFRRRNLGVIFGAVGVVVGVINIVAVQSLYTLNTYFLLLEGVVIISLALFSFARMMLHADMPPISRSPHFWLATILTFFWSTTFFNWGFYEYMNTMHPNKVWIVNLLLVVVNIITYASYGVLFLLYPSLQRKQ